MAATNEVQVEQAVAAFREDFQTLRSEVGKMIVGHADIVEGVLVALFAGGHVLLEGVPGLGKTLLIRSLSQALSLEFSRVQFTPDLMPADIIGMELLQDDPATGRRSMKFVPGPIFANIILADEINRTPPKTQSALLEAMQEHTVTSMGRSHQLDEPFVVVATQNPIEQEGTYPLPEAQLDRFMFSLWVDYPTVEEEEQIVHATTQPREIVITPVFARDRLLAYQRLVRRMPASSHVVSYAVALARATRPGCDTADEFVRQYVEWGAGPRAAQHMVMAGKAMAALDGVPAVTCEHIRQAAPLVLRHRVLPNYHAGGEGLNSVAIIEHILQTVTEPAYGA